MTSTSEVELRDMSVSFVRSAALCDRLARSYGVARVLSFRVPTQQLLSREHMRA